MATCSDVAAFLGQVSSRSVTEKLAPADLNDLVGHNLVRLLTPDEFTTLQGEVQALEAAQRAIAEEAAQRQQAASAVGIDTRKAHSILFHLQGVDAQHAELERLEQDQTALRQIDDELAKRQQAFAQLLVKKATLDMVTPYNGDFVAITPAGRMALRDLSARLYRVGTEEFPAYWDQSQKVDAELWAIANQGAQLEGGLSGALHDVDRSYLWALAIGMVKVGGDLPARLTGYLAAYQALAPHSENLENRLLSAEVLSLLPTPLAESVQWIDLLLEQVRDMSVPDDAALGIAAILLLGRRSDGSFATEPLARFLTGTPSFEAAALLAIVNRPYDELASRFAYLKSLFAAWGYSASEDTELSSAYLASSEIPLDSVSPKLAIISRGLHGYLQYPLVGAAILSSIPVLEANETLSLLEKAYEILGQRTGPMSQAELISLSIRMIHGVEVRSVDELDPTARQVPPTPGFSYANTPLHLWAPVFITHGMYYSTFSGIGGPHPGHVHTWGGGGWGGGGYG